CVVLTVWESVAITPGDTCCAARIDQLYNVNYRHSSVWSMADDAATAMTRRHARSLDFPHLLDGRARRGGAPPARRLRGGAAREVYWFSAQRPSCLPAPWRFVRLDR